MECAAKDGVLICGATLERLTSEQLDELGVQAKQVHRPMFAHRLLGVPADITMYRLETRRHLPSCSIRNRYGVSWVIFIDSPRHTSSVTEGIVKLFGNACGAVDVSGPAGKR